MRASDIAARGLSLADLANAKFITTNDRNNSLNESWRDLYSDITDSDDDYYVETVLLPWSSAISIDNLAYAMPVPDNCYKIRSVEYPDPQGIWQAMHRFPMSERNKPGPQMMYRWRGNQLWLVVASTINPPQNIRLTYYPSPRRLNAPDSPIEFGKSLSEAARGDATWPFFASEKEAMLWMSGTTLYAQTKTSAPIALNAAIGGATHVAYNKGYIFYARSAQVWRTASELAAVITPVALVGPVNATALAIIRQQLYYYNSVAADWYVTALTGGAGAALGLGAVSWLTGYQGGLAYLSGGAITVPAGVVPGITATALGSDGGDVLYYMDAPGLHRLVLDGLTVVSDEIIDADVGGIGLASNGFIPATGYTSATIKAIDGSEDTLLEYPTNLVPEVLAYQFAIDCKRKQDPTGASAQALMLRKAELRDTMLKALKRDEYQLERINNAYARRVQYP